MENQKALAALGNLNLAMNQIQALAAGIESLEPQESSVAYLAQMIQDLASSTVDLQVLEAELLEG